MNFRVLREGMPEQMLARDIKAAKQYNEDAKRRHAELVAKVTAELAAFKSAATELAKAEQHKLRTTPYVGEKVDLLDYTERIGPQHLEMKRSDAIEYAKLALTALNIELDLLGHSPITQEDAAILADFCIAQEPPVWAYDINGDGLFAAWRILTFEGALQSKPALGMWTRTDTVAAIEQPLQIPPPELRPVPRDPYEGIEAELERECPYPKDAEDEPWMRKNGTSASGERETWFHRNRTAKILERDRRELAMANNPRLNPVIHAAVQELADQSQMRIFDAQVVQVVDKISNTSPMVALSRENFRRYFFRFFGEQMPAGVMSPSEAEDYRINVLERDLSAEEFRKSHRLDRTDWLSTGNIRQR